MENFLKLQAFPVHCAFYCFISIQKSYITIILVVKMKSIIEITGVMPDPQAINNKL